MLKADTKSFNVSNRFLSRRAFISIGSLVVPIPLAQTKSSSKTSCGENEGSAFMDSATAFLLLATLWCYCKVGYVAQLHHTLIMRWPIVKVVSFYIVALL